MAFRLFDTVYTPKSFQFSISSGIPYPLSREKPLVLYLFFYNENPDRWLAEIFATQNRENITKFVEYLRIISK